MYNISIFNLELRPIGELPPAHLMDECNRGEPISRAEISDGPGRD